MALSRKTRGLERHILRTTTHSRALDQSSNDDAEKLLVRIGTAVGKYWICKRTPGHASEAMECLGGSGVMEDSILPRLFRESPVNAIWEGSGNVQCLDMLRAMRRSPGAIDAFMNEVELASGRDARLDRFVEELGCELRDQENIEYRCRRIVEHMALAFQGSLLVRSGDGAVAEAFCASRLTKIDTCGTYGALRAGLDCRRIIQRATPQQSA
ncbi:MAG: hypothetical protein GY725_23750 [bacterium]|nr:hypothetical protein [bacterium]